MSINIGPVNLNIGTQDDNVPDSSNESQNTEHSSNQPQNTLHLLAFNNYEQHINPSIAFNQYIKEQFNIQGTWKISGKGLNIFYNSQPKTLPELNTNFDVDNFFNNYSSRLIVKQSKQDSRYILCLATPDLSEGVSYRTSYGFQPGFIHSKINGETVITIQDYDDNGFYTLRDFLRDENGSIYKIFGEYRESGYNYGNRYQVPTCGAIELEKMNNDVNTNFVDVDNTSTIITTKNAPKQTVISTYGEDDYYFYNSDYFSKFKAISSTRYNSLRTVPLLGKNNNIIGQLYTVYKYTLDKGESKCTSETIIHYYPNEYEYKFDRNYSILPFNKSEGVVLGDRSASKALIFTPISWTPNVNEDISTGTFDSVGVPFIGYNLNGEEFAYSDVTDIEIFVNHKLNEVDIQYVTPHPELTINSDSKSDESTTLKSGSHNLHGGPHSLPQGMQGDQPYQYHTPSQLQLEAFANRMEYYVRRVTCLQAPGDIFYGQEPNQL